MRFANNTSRAYKDYSYLEKQLSKADGTPTSAPSASIDAWNVEEFIFNALLLLVLFTVLVCIIWFSYNLIRKRLQKMTKKDRKGATDSFDMFWVGFLFVDFLISISLPFFLSDPIEQENTLNCALSFFMFSTSVFFLWLIYDRIKTIIITNYIIADIERTYFYSFSKELKTIIRKEVFSKFSLLYKHVKKNAITFSPAAYNSLSTKRVENKYEYIYSLISTMNIGIPFAYNLFRLSASNQTIAFSYDLFKHCEKRIAKSRQQYLLLQSLDNVIMLSPDFRKDEYSIAVKSLCSCLVQHSYWKYENSELIKQIVSCINQKHNELKTESELLFNRIASFDPLREKSNYKFPPPYEETFDELSNLFVEDLKKSCL